MSTIKNPTRFAELEYCLQGYFDGKLAPVMKQVRDDLTHKQLEERGRYQSSLAGVLASANPYADNTEFVLKQTGKWNSKTTEDYLANCFTNERIDSNKEYVSTKFANDCTCEALPHSTISTKCLMVSKYPCV